MRVGGGGSRYLGLVSLIPAPCCLSLAGVVRLLWTRRKSLHSTVCNDPRRTLMSDDDDMGTEEKHTPQNGLLLLA